MKTNLLLRVACVALYFGLALESSNVLAHGVKDASANIDVRSNRLLELRVQFDLVALLNHNGNHYSLPLLASLSEEDFGKLYAEVIKLFDRELIVKRKGEAVELHRRYPTQQQVSSLIKRQFVESSIEVTPSSVPYTYSDRRFYQLFFFDLKLKSKNDLDAIQVNFPAELGDIYVTYSDSISYQVHKGATWSSRSKPH